MSDAQLRVNVLGDDKSVNRVLGRVETRLGRFGKRVDAVSSAGAFGALGSGVGLGAIAGGAALAVGLQKSIDVASNLNEQLSKTRDVFGQATAGVEAFAETSAQDLGLARDQTLELASTFGALLRPVGLVGQESAKLSQDLLARGADLASFYNTDVKGAIDAIRSGIVGESEPLRAYGVQLSESRVQAVALKDTGKELASQLTTQDKVLARIKILMGDSSIAAGNFEKTSGGLANQSKILSAQLRDLQAEIGSGLLPIVTDLVTKMNEGIDAAQGFGNALQGALGAVGANTISGQLTPQDLLDRNTRDRIAQVFGPDALFDLLNKTTSAGLATRPEEGAAGHPATSTRTPPKTAAEKTPPLAKGLPQALQGRILDARISGDQGALLKALIEGRDALRKQLTDPRLQGKPKLEVKQALLAMTGEIQAIYADQAAEADRAKQDARDAREKARRDQAAARERAKQARNDALAAQTAFQDSLVQKAEDLRSAALAALDRKQSDRDTGRALADAKEALANVLPLGDPNATKEARRNVEDAKLDRERFLLEQATIRPGRGRDADNARVPAGERGYTVYIGNVTLPGVTSAQELLRELQRLGQNTAASRRGRYPGTRSGI